MLTLAATENDAISKLPSLEEGIAIDAPVILRRHLGNEKTLCGSGPLAQAPLHSKQHGLHEERGLRMICDPARPVVSENPRLFAQVDGKFLRHRVVQSARSSNIALPRI